MTERYNRVTHKFEPSPERIERFLDAYEALCREHGLSLSHEDTGGEFIINTFHEKNIKWLREAALDLETTEPRRWP